MKPFRIGAPPLNSYDWKMTHPGRYKSYTIEQNEFVKNNYLKFTDKELGIQINRSECSIANKRRELRLTRPTKFVIGYNVRIALREVKILRETFCVIQDMKALILMIGIEKNQFKRDNLKKELRRLDVLKIYKYVKVVK